MATPVRRTFARWCPRLHTSVEYGANRYGPDLSGVFAPTALAHRADRSDAKPVACATLQVVDCFARRRSDSGVCPARRRGGIEAEFDGIAARVRNWLPH